MNKIVNRFLLAGDKFMSEMHLRRPDLPIILVDNSLKQRKNKKNERNKRFMIYLTKRTR